MHLPDSDDRTNALIRADRAQTGDGLDAARGIGWMCWAAVLVVIVVGMCVALGVR